MKYLIILIMFSIITNAHAEENCSFSLVLLPPQAAVSDTVSNRTLEHMLLQFNQSTDKTALRYDSWMFSAHRALGYTIAAAAAAQVILGFRTWNERKAGREPDTKTAHKYIGYSTAGLSLAQSTLGAVTLWKMRGKESGKTKRLVHFGISALATAGFVTAAAIAYGSRKDIENGTAAKENKTFDDLYSNHRAAGILSGVSVLLTIAVIEW